VHTMNGCRYGGKGDGPGLPPGRRRGLRGKTPPPNLNSRGRVTKRRMKMEKKGK
jgi:hypothetical protein